jgi:hypothetical protein
MSLALDQITGEVLETFRLMLLGSETKIVILENQRSGFYHVIGRARNNFFVYNDPTGDVLRLFVNEKYVTPEDASTTAAVVLEQAAAVGYYGRAEGLNPGEYVVYSFMSRKAPFGSSLRMWEFHLAGKADVFRE